MPTNTPRDNTYIAPATSGSFYTECEAPVCLELDFCPGPTRDWLAQDWFAVMEVKCYDISRLMREGIHWGAANIVREEGFMEENDTGLLHDSGRKFAGKRIYFLRHLQQQPLWCARVEVYGLEWATLPRFDFCLELSRERVQCAKGYSFHPVSKKRNFVYSYEFGRPACCYNAIYDDMPLEGWWPWPRKECATYDMDNKHEKTKGDDAKIVGVGDEEDKHFGGSKCNEF
ncbi:hypothetical protein F5Y16DRAFT_415993 [Xylariaceae sp. FL0255]|nr:hypothetical protein F5Y16DRAFT_415993 [Xylariaceae sp. FL0255]